MLIYSVFSGMLAAIFVWLIAQPSVSYPNWMIELLEQPLVLMVSYLTYLYYDSFGFNPRDSIYPLCTVCHSGFKCHWQTTRTRSPRKDVSRFLTLSSK